MTDAKVRITDTSNKKQQLVSAIRNWIHMDNLAENLQLQVSNARAVRNKHETEVLSLLHDLNLDHSEIQVSGATLRVEKNKEGAPPTTWGPIEHAIHAWAVRSHISRTQAQELTRFLHNRFAATEKECLKKVV